LLFFSYSINTYYYADNSVFFKNVSRVARCLQDFQAPGHLVRAIIQKSGVEYAHTLSYNDRIFPNLATTKLNIASVEAPKPFWIIDMLGRTILSGMTLDNQTLTVDISALKPGVYDVISMGIFGKIIIGKLLVVLVVSGR
jgi:hypothetical protein